MASALGDRGRGTGKVIWFVSGRAMAGRSLMKEWVIANLLPASGEAPVFAALEPGRLVRLEDRLRSAAALWTCAPEISMQARFAEDLEDLESSVSTSAAEALLERIAGARTAEIARRGPGATPSVHGRFVLHRFARSLETGEAEIASRGFFDACDRPPLMLWLEVVSRALPRRPGTFEVGILAFVPEDCVDRAEAGRVVCPNGSLSFLDEDSSELGKQLAPLSGGRSTR